jgi:threonine synthase
MDGTILCDTCNTDYGTSTTAHRCPACGNPLSFALPERSFPAEVIASRAAHMWRYAEALPAFDEPISLGEPVTPLVPVQIGALKVLAKCEFQMPSGSYKDRGSAFLASYLKQAGVVEAMEDSSGNAGASLAAYMARGGMGLTVFCPDSASAGKLAQIQLHGATVEKIPGARPRATAALMAALEGSGAVYASHSWHPLFLEGLRTMAYEIAEQLDWSAPDYVCCPVGGGSILIGLFNGFSDLLEAGVIERMPRLIAVQAENVSPVCDAFAAGLDEVPPAADPQPTLAEGIALVQPARHQQLLHALRSSNGHAIAVSEADIVEGVHALGRAGFFVEPTSAVVWKGLTRFHEDYPIVDGSTIVAILSGHGLKASEKLAQLASSPTPQP